MKFILNLAIVLISALINNQTQTEYTSLVDLTECNGHLLKIGVFLKIILLIFSLLHFIQYCFLLHYTWLVLSHCLNSPTINEKCITLKSKIKIIFP